MLGKKKMQIKSKNQKQKIINIKVEINEMKNNSKITT